MDDFRVKYIGEEHARHLMDVLKLYYKMEEYWKGQLYRGITLNWNCYEGYVDIPTIYENPHQVNTPGIH